MDAVNGVIDSEVYAAGKPKVPTGYRVVAAIEFLSGAGVLAGLIYTGGKVPVELGASIPSFVPALVMLMSVIAILGLFAGVLLWVGHPAGVAGTIVILSCQIPTFSFHEVRGQTASQYGINFIPIVLLVVLSRATKQKEARARAEKQAEPDSSAARLEDEPIV